MILMLLLAVIGAAQAQTMPQCGTLGDTAWGAQREASADTATLQCFRDFAEHQENMTALNNGAVGAGLTVRYYENRTQVTGTVTGESYVRTSRGTVQAIGKVTAPTAALAQGGFGTLRVGDTWNSATSRGAAARGVLRDAEAYGRRSSGSSGSSGSSRKGGSSGSGDRSAPPAPPAPSAAEAPEVPSTLERWEEARKTADEL